MTKSSPCKPQNRIQPQGLVGDPGRGFLFAQNSPGAGGFKIFPIQGTVDELGIKKGEVFGTSPFYQTS